MLKLQLEKMINEPDGLEMLVDTGHAGLVKGEWTNVQCYVICIDGERALYFKPKCNRTMLSIVVLGSGIGQSQAHSIGKQLCEYMSIEFNNQRTAGAESVRSDIRKTLGL